MFAPGIIPTPVGGSFPALQGACQVEERRAGTGPVPALPGDACRVSGGSHGAWRPLAQFSDTLSSQRAQATGAGRSNTSLN